MSDMDQVVRDSQNVLPQAEETLRFSEALQDAAAVLTSTLKWEEVLDRILDQAARVIPHDASSIALLENGFARLVRCRGFRERGLEEFVLSQRFPINPHQLYGQMLRTRQPLTIYDAQAHRSWLKVPETQWIHGHVATPIIAGDEVVGFVNLDSETAGAFTARHAHILQVFASFVAIAIQNSRHARTLEHRVRERMAELVQVKDQSDAILNSTNDAIALARIDGTIQRVNPAFERLFGMRYEEVIGQSVWMYVAPDDAYQMRSTLDEAVRENRSARVEVTFWRSDEAVFEADVVVSPVKERDSQIQGVVVSIRDNTERMRIESELRAALERERELSELKSRFVSMASHEFRTPLAVMMTASELLRHYGSRMTEEQKQDRLERIQDEVRSMVRLIEDVLTVNRTAKPDHVDFNPVLLDLAVFCRKLADQVQAEVGHERRVDIHLAGTCGRVLLDQNLFRDIFTQLLSNAFKYSSPDMPVEVRLNCDEERVIIDVTDHGKGIPLEDQPLVFDLFHRGQNVDTIPGTGLGLTIARQAAELHGGTITFFSELGVGTTFRLTIPNVVLEERL